jgi:Galactose oxidase, central domain/Stigma-specific protein, Stig1/Kelch motif
MRHQASPFVLLAAAVFAPLACSLAVSSELDGKPAASDSESDGGTTDAPGDALDEPADQASPDVEDGDTDAPDASEDGEVGAGCLACPESCCAGVCADLKNDPLNCGECGNACNAGRDCSHSKCKNGFVTVSEVGAPEARYRGCAVWTGSEMFVWGGITPEGILLNSGAMYDPKTDTWRDVALNGAPSPREEPTCVAMNGKVFVWGGVDWSQSLLMQDGAVWDPSSDSWTPLGDADGPAPRIRATAFWTGNAVLIWGGERTDAHQEKSGSMYDPNEDLWRPISTAGAPAHAKRQAWAWTGSTMYVFGGRDDGGGNVYNDMHSYSPTLNVWLPVVGVAPPSVRSNAFATWTGSAFLVWGGMGADQVGLIDGASYDPVSLIWTPLSTVLPPNGRALEMFRSGWSQWMGDEWLIAGGSDINGVQPDIARFDPAAAPDKAWSEALPWDPKYLHEWGVGVWTGEEFIVWGGSDGSDPVVGGSRWMP